MTYLIITFRVFLIMGLAFYLVLVTGRRKIGELPVFDFLAIIVLGNVIGADIADPKVPHLPTVYALILLIGIQYYISYFVVRSRSFGKKVTFSPKVVIQNGQFVKTNMTKLRYSIENVLMYLREKGIFDLNEVEFAIVEDSGNISVQKKSQYQPVTPFDLNIPTKYKGVSLPLVIEGKIHENNLRKLNLDQAWLETQLQNSGIKSLTEVFYLDINTAGKLYISKEFIPDSISDHFKF